MHGAKIQLTDEQKMDWLQLIRSQQIGPKIFHKLINKYGGAGNAIAALPEFIAQTNNKKIKLAARDAVLYEWENIQKFGAKIIALGEDEYPEPLKFSANPPPLLTVKGDISQLQKPALSIVGTRNCSALGLKLTQKISSDVGREGYCIVSGFARGIDSKAHAAALGTGTIACLAGGINIIYPPENDGLYQEFLAQKGLFVTEMPFNLTPKAVHFPRRNRIIAGISHATLVIEAAIKSGSLITAQMAADLGREVLAVPGHPLDSRAAGPNSLIKRDATLVRHKDDVLDAIAFIKNNHLTALPNLIKIEEPEPDLFAIAPEIKPKKQAIISQESKNSPEQVIMQLLTTSPIDRDNLLRESNLTTEIFNSTLVELELDDKIEQIYGQGIQLCS